MLMQLGQQESGTFAMVSDIRTYDDAVDTSNPFFAAVYIRYDPRYLSYNRQVYSILGMLGDIGGLQQMLYLIGFVSVSFFTKRLFVASVLKEMYHLKHDRGKIKEQRSKVETPGRVAPI